MVDKAVATFEAWAKTQPLTQAQAKHLLEQVCNAYDEISLQFAQGLQQSVNPDTVQAEAQVAWLFGYVAGIHGFTEGLQGYQAGSA